MHRNRLKGVGYVGVCWRGSRWWGGICIYRRGLGSRWWGGICIYRRGLGSSSGLLDGLSGLTKDGWQVDQRVWRHASGLSGLWRLSLLLLLASRRMLTHGAKLDMERGHAGEASGRTQLLVVHRVDCQRIGVHGDLARQRAGNLHGLKQRRQVGVGLGEVTARTRHNREHVLCLYALSRLHDRGLICKVGLETAQQRLHGLLCRIQLKKKKFFFFYNLT